MEEEGEGAVLGLGAAELGGGPWVPPWGARRGEGERQVGAPSWGGGASRG